MPRKVFVAGEILTAADVNTNLMDQSVMVFDDATDRATAIPTPVEGMVTYLKDTDEVDKFDGSAFVPVGIAPAILQVVQTVKTDVFSTSSISLVDVTDMVVSITPTSDSSKVLVTVNASVGHSSTERVRLAVTRNGTGINNHTGQNFFSQTPVPNNSDNIFGSTYFEFLDTPSTGSAVEYKLQMNTNSGTAFLNRNGTLSGRGVSSITLMEVAG